MAYRNPSYVSVTTLLLGLSLSACTGEEDGTSDSASDPSTSSPTTTVGPTTDPTTAGPTTEEPTTEDPSTTEDPTTTTEDPSTTLEPVCNDGEEQCVEGGHQLCEAGQWVDSPCADGEFCDADTGTCTVCSCSPGAYGMCVDEDNIEVCSEDCSGYVPEACGLNEICADGACVPKDCNPGSTVCSDDESFQECNAQGTGYEDPVPCTPGDVCDAGQCVSACSVAAQTKSSVGCEFWAVDMPNLANQAQLVYAVAISNPSDKYPVEVKVYDGNNNGNEQLLVTQVIQPRDVRVIKLSGTQGQSTGYYNDDAGFNGLGIAHGRGFRIESDLPVIATQFNPLGGSAGFTTEASLLLPTHALGEDYYHLAWANGAGVGSVMVIMATENNTDVRIKPTVGSNPGMGGLPALPQGVFTEVTVDKYDYIQVVANGNQDLTGSQIESNKPVAVFGGHSCGYVPSVSTAWCDHLEEQILPLETWGKNYIAARNPQRESEPMRWRIVASKDNTTVNFSPPVSLGNSVNLDAGEVVEFDDNDDFSISADEPILVAGYMLGCKSNGVGNNCKGDPYMVLMVPREQFKTDYVFLIDDSYTEDFAKLIRPSGAAVEVGCLGVVPENRWEAVGNSGYEVATINMNPGEANCTIGTNEASSDEKFGIIVSGQSLAASYAYPGGLVLEKINPLE